MKPALFALALVLPVSSALADFDPKGEIICRTGDKKILINDEFAGKGRALVSGVRRTYYAAPVRNQNGDWSVMISTGQRAFAPEYTIRLDLANAEITTRKEGNEMAQFYYIPAQVVTTSFWSGDQTVSAKCLQEIGIE